jgi:hypothetical protein
MQLTAETTPEDGEEIVLILQRQIESSANKKAKLQPEAFSPLVILAGRLSPAFQNYCAFIARRVVINFGCWLSSG